MITEIEIIFYYFKINIILGKKIDFLNMYI